MALAPGSWVEFRGEFCEAEDLLFWLRRLRSPPDSATAGGEVGGWAGEDDGPARALAASLSPTELRRLYLIAWSRDSTAEQLHEYGWDDAIPGMEGEACDGRRLRLCACAILASLLALLALCVHALAHIP